MRASRLKIIGAWLLEEKASEDSRGIFQTSWERNAEIDSSFSFQPDGMFHSHNQSAHTLRGLHYQRSPHGQAKIVSCVCGAIFDVIIDLRPASETYRAWESVELTPANGRALYIPAGCAHGFLTREDESTVAYLIEGAYVPKSQATVRWNDPIFAIRWPISDESKLILSERDRTAPDYAK